MNELTPSMTVMLGWPPKGLNPNARANCYELSRLKKLYRHTCYFTALQAAGVGKWVEEGDIRVHLVFVPPDRRLRDDDNLVAMMKSGLDGLADALKVNDRRFRLSQEVSQEIGGFVCVQMWPRPAKGD
jgi:crossover junction endodeoxyribonuclease RusA